jgi:hypothetical protein
MIRAMRGASALIVAGLTLGVLAAEVAAHTPSSTPAVRPRAVPGARSADDVLAEVRRATERYRDVARARADGYVAMSGMEARHGHHFVNVQVQLLAAASGTLDLTRPPVLLYVERDNVWQLVGVEYVLPARPAVDPFPGGEWHQHEASCHYRDNRELPAPRASACPPRHPSSNAEFVFWHPAFDVVHVWAWLANPRGPFAAENPALDPWGGAAPAGAGHHARSDAERLYSEFTHRIAGLILLVLAAVTAWEARKPRRPPWSLLSAGLWILFGLYLIPTSDPESWPWGPKRFAEIFTDPVVFQHKALALVTMMIGVVAGLRATGVLPRARWAVLAAGLATIGGGSLFVHFHEDRMHFFDKVYLQHALLGLAAVGLGGLLLMTRRSARGEVVLRWAWPMFLALFGAVLLVYREL